jgi:hypothetical protein
MRILEIHIRGLNIDADDERKIAVFHRYVGTKVMTTWNAMPEKEQFVWEKVKARMLENWSTERAAMHAQQTFETRTQKDDESYRQYMDSLLELAKNGWGDDIDKSKVCKQFYKGISDAKVAAQLCFAFQFHPINIIEQTKLVELTENAANVLSSAGGIRTVETKEEVVIPKRSTGNNQAANNATRSQNQNQTPARQDFQQRPPRNFPNPQRRNEYPTDAQWKNQALGFCFGCGQTGHQVRDCKDKFMVKSVEHINKMCMLFGRDMFMSTLPADVDVNDAREEITISLIRRMISGVECFTCGEEGHFSNNCVAENADRMKGEKAKERFMAKRKERDGLEQQGSDKLDKLLEEVIRQGRALEVLQHKENSRAQGRGAPAAWMDQPTTPMRALMAPRVGPGAAANQQRFRPQGRGAGYYPPPGNHAARARGIPMRPPPRGGAAPPIALISPGYGMYAVQQGEVNPQDYPLDYGGAYSEDPWYGCIPVYDQQPHQEAYQEAGNPEVDKEATITEIKDQGN